MRTTRPLRDYLREQFPGWLITDETREVETLTRPTVVIYPEAVNRINAAGRVLAVEAACQVWLLTEKIKPSEVETALDSTLFDLLNAIESADAFTWESASRAGLANAGHGYQIAIKTLLQIEQLKEQ